MPQVVMGPGGVGYVMGGGYVMGAPQIHQPHHALPHHGHHGHHAVHMPPVHLPPWLQHGGMMAAPGMPLPQENRKILPFDPSNGSGIFAAVTDRITYIAQPQKRFLGERPLVTIAKIGPVAALTAVMCSLFAVGTDPQQVELGSFGIEDFTGNALDLNIKMDPCEPGVKIRMDLFLIGGAFTPGTDSIFVSVKALGRSIG
jgi:hypothetical protein